MFKLTILVHKLQQMGKIKIMYVTKAISEFSRQETIKVTPNAIFGKQFVRKDYTRNK